MNFHIIKGWLLSKQRYETFANIALVSMLILSHQFDEYYQPPTPLPEKLVTTAGLPVKPKGFAMSFVQAAVRGRVESERRGSNPRQELTDYLNSNLDVGEVNPIEWWGVSATCYIVFGVLG